MNQVKHNLLAGLIAVAYFALIIMSFLVLAIINWFTTRRGK